MIHSGVIKRSTYRTNNEIYLSILKSSKFRHPIIVFESVSVIGTIQKSENTRGQLESWNFEDTFPYRSQSPLLQGLPY